MATFATWNPSDKAPSGTLSGGNLVFASGSANWYSARSTISVSSGKWYWEVTCTTGLNFMIGIGLSTATVADTTLIGVSDAFSWAYNGGGQRYNNGGSSPYGAGYTTGDVIGVSLDMGTGTINMYKNNALQGTMFTGLSGPQFAMVSVNNCSITANFGATAMTYTAPSGFNQGLYTGTIGGAASMSTFMMMGV